MNLIEAFVTIHPAQRPAGGVNGPGHAALPGRIPGQPGWESLPVSRKADARLR